MLGALDLFDLLCDVKNISFGKNEFVGRKLNKNRKAISLVLIVSIYVMELLTAHLDRTNAKK